MRVDKNSMQYAIMRVPDSCRIGGYAMKKYISAAGAARLIGVNEKTIRNWIVNGRLKARKAAKNRFNVLMADVEALQCEREQGETPNVSVLVARIEDLEQKYRELAALVDEKGRDGPVTGSLVSDVLPVVRPKKSVPSANVPVDLPVGSMLFADFAAKHGVPRATFSHHVKNGIAGDVVVSMKRPKPGRPEHTEYWLTPEQQEASLVFWERHGVAYTRPS